MFNQDIPIHLRGLVREVKEEINAVRRELLRLTEIDFVKAEDRGNRKFYMLNRDFLFYDELVGMFNKSFGLGGSIIKNLKDIGNVEYAVLTGSFINPIQKDAETVDLVLIGDINIEFANQIIEEAEKRMNRSIHYTVLKLNEFELKKRRRNSFIMDIITSPKIMLKGRLDSFCL